MLTQENLPELLTTLGFEKKGVIFKKTIGSAVMEVNTSKKEISYPEADGLVINERQTCNFDANENFVVLECVHRLLEKGYKPEHIELEPKWKLGRGASGGRADVLIKDNDGRSLLIIECKTAGTEFKRAWNKTQQDGDQLFSYAQQISETQFLCLYTSYLDAGAIKYSSHIIAHRDNEKYLADNPLFKSFKTVTDVKDRFAVWHDTYKLDYTTKGLFEDNIQPYHIGKDKYSLADLHAISAADQQKKYHEFATILRQHNVSGRENAFDKLVNLLLCKLVDEIENPLDLKFYWKGVAYDTHFELMDRLLQLYQAGMGKFLGEDITYIKQGDVNNALRFIRQNPDATQRAVWNLFIQQKFFTNNDFSLIDVHNEKLFYQNAEVLLKILQMWQDVRLTDPHGHNQFLGDMFEGFLDQGVKQSEGQYFTPMPICRFIIMSLPLESLIKRNPTPPKAIDYACGAGHFLTELALQIKPLVANHKPGVELAEYHKALYGVEKEYRLSKVAKVSAFMYGQQEINICYGDALINKHEAFPEIKDGTFDLLVANPPYSVRGFLETLPEEDRKAYTLTETINDLETSNSIETFFIERAKQLLRADGVAAIILPSSILSNGGSAYIRTREILIQYFDIVAIAEFGSGTFGKTGTNTVTLFLRRKKTAPDTATHYRERVEEWFKGCDASKRKQVIYKDEHLIAQYCNHTNVPLDDYKTLLKGYIDGLWAKHEHFEVYVAKFNSSTEVANLYKAKWFKALAAADQDVEINKRRLAFVQAIERDKLYHFAMASDQPNPVLIIRSPTDNKEQKKFLGYEWSSAKGGEGIQLQKDADGHHLTPLYDETNRDNAVKLNYCVAANFNRQLNAIPVPLQAVASTALLVDMLDFEKSEFEKQIGLAAKAKLTTISKWPFRPLGELARLNPKKGELKDVNPESLVSFVEMASVSENGYIAKSEPRRLGDLLRGSYTYFADGDIILAKITPCMENGKCALASNLSSGIGLGSSEFHVVRANSALALPEYLFAFINRAEVRTTAEKNMTGSSGHRRVPESFYVDLLIPLPPLAIQKQIVSEFEAIDLKSSQANLEIIELDQLIIDVCNEARSMGMKKLGSVTHKVNNHIDPQTQSGSTFYIGLENIESHTGQLVGKTTTSYADIKSAKVCFKPGNVLYGKLRPNLNKVYLAQRPGICSTDILVFQFADSLHAKFYARYFLCDEFNKDVLRGVSGQQLPRTSWGHMQTILIPAPPEPDLKKLVLKIEALEKKIAQTKAVADSASSRKQAILQKYL